MSKIKKTLHSIQNLLGLHICIKRKPSEVKESDEKLLNIFHELTVGISEVFEDKQQAFDEYLRCDKISCKISVLSEQIGQVRILYSLWKNGYDLNPEDLIVKLQSLNVLVDCIRDDVFNAYLRLPPEQKLKLLNKNKQVSAIFAVLGTLENEVSDMMKTMLPNEELMKVVKPLLKPNFNRVLYKRQAKNVYSYDSPASQAMQVSCKKVTYEPKLVDAWTDPIDREDWGYCDDLWGNANPIKYLAKKGLKPVYLTQTVSENKACQVSPTGDNESFNDLLIVENTVTLTEFKTQDRFSIDHLSITKTDINDATGSQHSFVSHQESWSSCSQEYWGANPFEPQQELSLWKLAAALIADQPVEG